MTGRWTIVVDGGPGFWANVMAMLDWAASDHPGTSGSVIAERMRRAEATYKPPASTSTTLRVWVVTVSVAHEGEWLAGVYATREQAENAPLPAEFDSDDERCVYEVEVGAAARYHGWHDRAGNRRPER